MHWCLASTTIATPRGLQNPLNTFNDLRGHGFLSLQASGKNLHHARQFGDPHNLAVGNISQMRMAQDGDHVMLTMALNRYVAQQDHIVVAGHFLESAAKDRVGVGFISGENSS